MEGTTRKTVGNICRKSNFGFGLAVFITAAQFAFYRFSSSKEKSSSMGVLSVREILYASRREGLYLPFSRKSMVCRVTSTLSARASWVMPVFSRYCFIFVFKWGSLRFGRASRIR